MDIPGVTVAQPVDERTNVGKEPTKIPKFFKGHGTNAVVSVVGRFLFPKGPLQTLHPNTWSNTTYEMVIQNWGRRKMKDERAYVLLLKPGARHDGQLDGDFYCRFAHAKIVTAAAPNQTFRQDDLLSQQGTPATQLADDEASDTDSEADEEDPNNEGGLAGDNDVPEWQKNANGSLKFRSEMSTCYRFLAEPASSFHGPSIVGMPEPGNVATPEVFMNLFFPTEWWRTKVLPAWNLRLAERRRIPVTEGESLVWRGLWRWKSLETRYKRDDFWDTVSPRDNFWNPPRFGEYMARNRFKDLTTTFSLRAPDIDSTRKDPFWEIREMQTAFNKYVHNFNSYCN
jgi:hypothetical protein